jgi:hypothetical protein
MITVLLNGIATNISPSPEPLRTGASVVGRVGRKGITSLRASSGHLSRTKLDLNDVKTELEIQATLDFAQQDHAKAPLAREIPMHT